MVKIGIVIHTELLNQIFSPADIERLESVGEVVATEKEKPIDEEEACLVLAGCEVGIGSWGTPKPDATIMGSNPQLRLWEHAAGSVKQHFGPHLEGRSLVIASCAPAIARNVAQMALGEIIIGLREVIPNARANREGRSPKPALYRNLSTCTVGIIGASHVGRELIKLLAPIGPDILLFDPYVDEEDAVSLGVELTADLVDLCRLSDAVSVHAPALDSTRRMLRADHFRAMKDNAVFVNTARGAVVDEQALIAELAKGRLFAFLDVSDPEPAASDSPLRSLPNVVYTSHIAGGKDFSIGRQAVDDVLAFLNGEAPKMVVTEDMLNRIA